MSELKLRPPTVDSLQFTVSEKRKEKNLLAFDRESPPFLQKAQKGLIG
jgi:hypothetical protein